MPRYHPTLYLQGHNPSLPGRPLKPSGDLLVGGPVVIRSHPTHGWLFPSCSSLGWRQLENAHSDHFQLWSNTRLRVSAPWNGSKVTSRTDNSKPKLDAALGVWKMNIQDTDRTLVGYSWPWAPHIELWSTHHKMSDCLNEKNPILLRLHIWRDICLRLVSARWRKASIGLNICE